MAEPSQDVDETASTTPPNRRVRLLQAYSHAIQDLEDNDKTVATRKQNGDEDVVFAYDSELVDSDHSLLRSKNNGSDSRERRKRMKRQRSVADVIEESFEIDEEMAPYKLINFLLYGGVAHTMPYFTLYSRQLGLDAAQLGMVCGIRPLLATVVAPLIGWFSDKYRLRRVSVILCVVSWLFFGVLVAFVKQPEIAECNDAWKGLKDIIPAKVVEKVDLTCLTLHNLNYPVTDSVTRHLFLEKVILPSITKQVKQQCKLDSHNSSRSSVSNSSDAVDTNQTAIELSPGDYKNRSSVDPTRISGLDDLITENMQKEAQDGRWLFDPVTLRDAFIAAFILASFAEMMQVMEKRRIRAL